MNIEKLTFASLYYFFSKTWQIIVEECSNLHNYLNFKARWIANKKSTKSEDNYQSFILFQG